MRSHARVVIVGGGMMGAGLLYHLAEEGWKDIVLIEKGELTSGSTWHAAGQCPSFIADYNMAKIHHYGNTLYPKLEEMTGQYVSWHGCGGIRFAMTDAEVEFFKHVEGVSKLIGYRMQLVGPNEIKQINPHVDVTGVKLGAWTLDDGHVDPAGCCNALAKGARDMGAEIIRRCRVTDIKPTATGEWEVITEQGNIICEHVVNAAGCYARQVAQWVGADVPICNMKHHYIVTEPIKEFVEADVEMPVMRDPYPDAYYRQEQKAGLIGIYETEGAEEAWAERGGFPEWESENELFSEELDRISPWIEKTLERMPIWAESGIKRIVHGAIPHTPDSNPLLGPAGGLKNYWMCNGSSIGIAQGAGCGKYLAQWMVHGEAEINMAGLDPRRYGKWATEDHVKSRSIEDYQHMYVLHVPGEERPAGRGQRKTSLHDVLAERGGLFSPTAGWERVKYYSKDGSEESPSYSRTNAFEVVAEECKGVMENAGLGEFSSFAKFEVTGPDSEKFLNRVLANKVPKKQGGIGLAHFLNDHGVIEGEVTITKLADNHYYLLSGALAEVRDEDWLNQHTDNDDVKIVNVTEYYGNLVLAGPKSREILASVTDADVSNETFRWLSAQTITVGGCEVRAARVNYIGELGWELHVRMEEMPKLFAALEEAGKPHGMVLFGIYAQNSMRMEKAYRGWGSELTNEITMIEADMERFVRFDKEDDFIGKAATQQRKQDGITQKLVYCEVDVDGSDVMGGEACVVNGDPVGIATSGGYGHRCGKSLAFAYVHPDLAEPGSTFDILMLGEARKATVLSEPTFDAANARLRS